MTRMKTKCTFDALLRFVTGFPIMRQKSLYFMHYYEEKQVFLWRAKKVQICCIITWKSRFSHDALKRCKFVALQRVKAEFLMTQPWTKCIFDALRFVAGVLITRQKHLYLIHYHVEKQVFSWCAKKVQIYCIITWKAGFLMTRPKIKCTFDALLRRKAGFLMTRQKLLYLLHYYVEKQVFPWHAKISYIWWINTWKSRFYHYATKNKVYIWCIITFHSRFSHDAPKNSYTWCINTWKSRFSHYATKNKVYIWCIITFWSRFSHDAPNILIFDALLRGKAGFLKTCQKGANLLHYFVGKQIFSWPNRK